MIIPLYYLNNIMDIKKTEQEKKEYRKQKVFNWDGVSNYCERVRREKHKKFLKKIKNRKGALHVAGLWMVK